MKWPFKPWRSYEEKSLAVLDYLHEAGEQHGLAIFKGAGIPRHSGYFTLQRMVEEGLLKARERPELPNHPEGRLFFSVTGGGRRKRVVLHQQKDQEALPDGLLVS